MIQSRLARIEREFGLSRAEMEGVVSAFIREMERGLKGSGSSLKMIPAFVDKPDGGETGEFLALDLGGSNYRVMRVRLEGSGRITLSRYRKFALAKKDITSDGKRLFGLLASSLKMLLPRGDSDTREDIRLGFTFSFPVEQKSISSGYLVRWTKGFGAGGVEGKDVVKLLERALRKKRINIRVVALVNDTVGTLAAASYANNDCDMGVILGTGTNACYVERVIGIKKLSIPGYRKDGMVVNIEWGNFDRLKFTEYDDALDELSDNPGEQRLEKMVGGMYLGRICRIVLNDLISEKLLFEGRMPDCFLNDSLFTGELVSGILADNTGTLTVVKAALNHLGVKPVSLSDARIVKCVCRIVAVRAAKIAASVIVAVVKKTDRCLEYKHTVAVDGSIYENLHGFSDQVSRSIKDLLRGHRGAIEIVLTKDGSGKGAAVVAAVAAS